MAIVFIRMNKIKLKSRNKGKRIRCTNEPLTINNPLLDVSLIDLEGLGNDLEGNGLGVLGGKHGQGDEPELDEVPLVGESELLNGVLVVLVEGEVLLVALVGEDEQELVHGLALDVLEDLEVKQLVELEHVREVDGLGGGLGDERLQRGQLCSSGGLIGLEVLEQETVSLVPIAKKKRKKERKMRKVNRLPCGIRKKENVPRSKISYCCSWALRMSLMSR